MHQKLHLNNNANQNQNNHDNKNNNNINNYQQNSIVHEPYVSQITQDKADAFRIYIERKYTKRKQDEQEKKENWERLLQKMKELQISLPEQELLKREILAKEAQLLRARRKKITVKDFEAIAIIGRGAFGEVRVCKWKEKGEIVAMKKMNKTEMLNKNQVSHIRAERDILATAKNPWIVELKCSFQDDKHLYLIMEYLAGGDLMTLLMKKDILTEEESKFYIAETILAVESVHKLNYIHRDLKPDNILLDSNGHIKLSDFGLCKHAEIRPRKFEYRQVGKEQQQKEQQQEQQEPILTKSNLAKKPNGFTRNRRLAYSTVGTPDYIAPEVFKQNGYTETIDWWSVGVILFEMLVGYPPFFADDPATTCQKIMNWKKTLVIPKDANLSPAAQDILKKLIADPNERLGVNGVEEIKAHPFFAGIDWKRIREKKAPNIPKLKSEIDTSNFDQFEEEQPLYVEDNAARSKRAKKDLNFIGYTFKRDLEAQRTLLIAALQELEANKASHLRAKAAVVAGNPSQDQSDNKEEVQYNNGNGINAIPNVFSIANPLSASSGMVTQMNMAAVAARLNNMLQMTNPAQDKRYEVPKGHYSSSAMTKGDNEGPNGLQGKLIFNKGCGPMMMTKQGTNDQPNELGQKGLKSCRTEINNEHYEGINQPISIKKENINPGARLRIFEASNSSVVRNPEAGGVGLGAAIGLGGTTGQGGLGGLGTGGGIYSVCPSHVIYSHSEIGQSKALNVQNMYQSSITGNKNQMMYELSASLLSKITPHSNNNEDSSRVIISNVSSNHSSLSDNTKNLYKG